MRFRNFGNYLVIPSRADDPDRYIQELKHLEWIFIAIRWLGVFALFTPALLYRPDQTGWLILTSGLLAFCNVLASLLNIKIKTPQYQHGLGISMLVVDTMLAWGVILLFVTDVYTATYLCFIYVIIEAAIRFGLIGSLSMIPIFTLGIYGHYEYRLIVLDQPFNTSSYIFWTTLMSTIAISAGIIIHEGGRKRWQREKYLKESTLLLERNRISRELHDTVLKTLQGLSLEARALQNRTATTTPSVQETARYIEEVCSRTSQEIREVILDLRTEDELTGIASQISMMINKWSGITGIPAEITQTGQDMILPAESNRHLRNIVAEVLANIQRHASASRIETAIDISIDSLNIKISDNGRGIGQRVENVNNFVSGGKLGIAGMKERVEILGGRLSLISDQSGTTVDVSVPVSHQIRSDKL